MAGNTGGITDRWYPVMDIAPHQGVPRRLIWTDAVEGYLNNLPAPHQGLIGWRMDQDRTICCGGCQTFAQAPGVEGDLITVATNPAHASSGLNTWLYGTAPVTVSSISGSPATNYAGAAGWALAGDGYGWIGTGTPSLTGGASRSNVPEVYYSHIFDIPPGTAQANLTWTAFGADRIVEVWINGVLIDAPGGNGPTSPASGQVNFAPLIGENWISVRVHDGDPGPDSEHGFQGLFQVWYVDSIPWSNPINDGMWWADPLRPETNELLGFRVWPGTEIVVRQSYLNNGGTDALTGHVTCGKAILNATIQITATTARGTQLGMDLLLGALTNSCSCGNCGGGVDISLYSGCDPAAVATTTAPNISRRILRGAVLTGWEDVELNPLMPSHNGRLITITMEIQDGRLWLDPTEIFPAGTAIPDIIEGGPTFGAVTNMKPGPRYVKEYTYLRDRTAWPVVFNNDGTATPVGNWSTLNSLQAAFGSSHGEGYVYADGYSRVDPDGKHPVRIIYDRTLPLLYFETIGWTWPTGIALPCDFDVEIIEFAQRTADDSSFETFPNPGADCAFWIQPSYPQDMVTGPGTITAQGVNTSRGPLTAVGPYAGTYVWAPDDMPDPEFNKQINLGCTFKWYRPISECPPAVDTNPALSGLYVDLAVAANGQMTWEPTAASWSYAGGTFPPQNRSFVISNQNVAPISTVVSVVSSEPVCEDSGLCMSPIPPITPDFAYDNSCEGGASPFPGGTLYAAYKELPAIPLEQCATLVVDLVGTDYVAPTSSEGYLSVMVIDITDIPGTPTVDDMWLTGFISCADFRPYAGDGRIYSLDGVHDIVTAQCEAGGPYIPFEPWGTHGVWAPPSLMGGRKYALCFFAVTSAVAFDSFDIGVELHAFSRG